MISSVRHVTSIDIPELEPYRTLKRPLAHRKLGLFIAEGALVVERFIKSRLTVVSILLTDYRFEQHRAVLETRQEPVMVYIAEKKLLETIVGFRCHQGLMALGIVPPPATIGSVLADTPAPHLFVALDRLTSAENTGVVARNCAACGVQALIVGETSADPYLRRSVRNSVGTIFDLPIIHTKDLAATLHDLRIINRFRVMAAHPRPDSTPLGSADFSGSCCIVFGSEGEGVSAAVLNECDESVIIPMANGVDSINVASASAVILYQAMK
ncbi:MAG: RNA methyltransferase [Chitinispirillaceae bacterium]|jgi:tRNA G18 (ribose-2'-O)-methylase SpoU|nr:RNA methyltransferase [Chitinispirillaceae bacterium]